MSTRLMAAALFFVTLVSAGPAFAAAAPAVTATGIPLDAPWKVRLHELAHSKFLYPGLLTKTGRRIGAERAAELKTFLDCLQDESLDGRAM